MENRFIRAIVSALIIIAISACSSDSTPNSESGDVDPVSEGSDDMVTDPTTDSGPPPGPDGPRPLDIAPNASELAVPSPINPYGRTWLMTGYAVDDDVTMFENGVESFRFEFVADEVNFSNDPIPFDGLVRSIMFCRSGTVNYRVVNDMELMMRVVGFQDYECSSDEIEEQDRIISGYRSIGDGLAEVALGTMVEAANDTAGPQNDTNIFVIDEIGMTMTETTLGRLRTFWVESSL